MTYTQLDFPDFSRGEPVKIKEGPFEGFEGVVDENFPDRNLVRVLVIIFDRLTPLELENSMLEKIDAA